MAYDRHHETCKGHQWQCWKEKHLEDRSQHLPQVISMEIHSWTIPKQDDIKNNVVDILVSETNKQTPERIENEQILTKYYNLMSLYVLTCTVISINRLSIDILRFYKTMILEK